LPKSKADKLEARLNKLQDKAAKNMAQANKTRQKLDKARASKQHSGVDSSFGNATPS
jgi:hypothetical protein